MRLHKSSVPVLVIVGLAICDSAFAFDCSDAKCREITSCAEAAYKLHVCGDSERDADNDGIPCENLCGQSLDGYRRFLATSHPDIAAAASTSDSRDITAPSPTASAPGGNGPALALTSSTRPEHEPTGFTCGAKRTCRQMSSCEEARFHLENCGVRSLDGDRDGVPCNTLCRRR